MHLPAHTDISDTFRIIKSDLQGVKELIFEQFAGTGDPIDRMLAGFSSGKMIRPALVLLSGSACGKIADKHIRVAAIFEIIHSATLLHDDVIDEGQKRRGLPTVNSLWGNESAVLLGDFLLSKVLSMCADLEPQIVRIIADTTTRICKGELKQIMQRQNWELNEPEYIDIITEKTAMLFSNCCYLGCFLSGATPEQVRSLGCFGLNAGIAFQITDDLLDIVGQESKTGKTLGSDVNKNKLTLAVIHLLRTTDEGGRKAVVGKLKAAGAGKRTLIEMLESCGSLEYAQRRAKEFAAKAVESLVDFEESEAKAALAATAEFVANRAI